jgi:hypothetical protein
LNARPDDGGVCMEPAAVAAEPGSHLLHRKGFDIALRKAEQEAEVEALPGGLRHPYRRKWATERKTLPLIDVMAAGGWKDTQTPLTCHQHADEETMLRVMEAPVKLMNRRRMQQG